MDVGCSVRQPSSSGAQWELFQCVPTELLTDHPVCKCFAWTDKFPTKGPTMAPSGFPIYAPSSAPSYSLPSLSPSTVQPSSSPSLAPTNCNQLNIAFKGVTIFIFGGIVCAHISKTTHKFILY